MTDPLGSERSWTWAELTALPTETVHGGPVRLLVPHLHFCKSAKWVDGATLSDSDRPGFWESYGYHNYGDLWPEQRYQGD